MPSLTVTTLLRDWRSGDVDALDELTPLVYDDLRRIAANRLRGERPEHTLQATALVNEVFLRLSEGKLSIQDRAHFFAIAARMMRRILTDHGRAHRSQKRGGSVQHVPLAEEEVAGAQDVDFEDLDDALNELAKIDARKSDILVLHYFGGMTYEETAAALNTSPATVDRDLRFAKAWLAHALNS